MSRAQLGYAGSCLTVVGSLLPFNHVILRNENALVHGPGLMLIGLAALSFFVARIGRYRWLAVFGALELVLLTLNYAAVRGAATRVAEFNHVLTGAMNSVWSAPLFPAAAENPFFPAVYVQYGFWIVAAGAILLLCAALMPNLHASGNATR